MIIYDPPTADASKREWQDYKDSLDTETDSEEIKRVSAFMKMRFAPGFDLATLFAGD